MLPKLNGYEVLRLMRAGQNWTPVLMLTAKGRWSSTRTDALRVGALMDYMTKPFSFRVLMARLARACCGGGRPSGRQC